MAHVRPFQPSDSRAVGFICRATLPPSLARSEPGVRLAPYLWALPFTHLSPATCMVLDDGHGGCVGYCVGTPDVFALAREYPRYVAGVLGGPAGRADVPLPAQLARGEPWCVAGREADGVVNEACLAQLAYSVDRLLLEGVEGKAELVRTWRATRHVDLLEPYQRQGWGRKLIEAFVQSVVEASKKAEDGAFDVGRGVQIGVAGENKKVVPFYEKLGFTVYPGGEKEGGNVWMVRDIA